MTVSVAAEPAVERVARIVGALGANIERRWNEEMRREERFGDIAADELARSGLLDEVSMDDVVDWTLRAPQRPDQQYRKFGDPPINLFIGHGFYIECLVWLDGDTAVHEHAFSGAFAVLHGSSVHARYRFSASAVESRNFIAGSSELVDAELLRAGDIRRIEKGSALTHSLYHLESPTFSIVVRTDGDKTFDQHVLFHRHALVLEELEEPEETLVRLVDSVARAAPRLYERHLRAAVVSWSGFAAFRVVSAGLRHCPAVVRAAAASDDAELARRLSILIPAAEQQLELEAMARVVRESGDADMRKFFGVLMNVPDRERALRVLGDVFPGEDPLDAAARFVEAYAAKLYRIDFRGCLARIARQAFGGDADCVRDLRDAKAARAWEKLRAAFMFRSLSVIA